MFIEEDKEQEKNILAIKILDPDSLHLYLSKDIWRAPIFKLRAPNHAILPGQSASAANHQTSSKKEKKELGLSLYKKNGAIKL